MPERRGRKQALGSRWDGGGVEGDTLGIVIMIQKATSDLNNGVRGVDA